MPQQHRGVTAQVKVCQAQETRALHALRFSVCTNMHMQN